MTRPLYTRYREAFLRGLKICQQNHKKIHTEADVEFNVRAELKKEISARHYITGNTWQACRKRGLPKLKVTNKNEYVEPDLAVCEGKKNDYLCWVELKKGPFSKLIRDIDKYRGGKNRRTVWTDTWMIGFSDEDKLPKSEMIDKIKKKLTKKLRVMMCGKFNDGYDRIKPQKSYSNNVLRNWMIIEISKDAVVLHLNANLRP